MGDNMSPVTIVTCHTDIVSMTALENNTNLVDRVGNMSMKKYKIKEVIQLNVTSTSSTFISFA